MPRFYPENVPVDYSGMPPVTATTESLPPQQRGAFWHSSIAGIFKSTVEIEIPETIPFNAESTCFLLGNILLAEIIATSHAIKVTPLAGSNLTFAWISVEGRALISQGSDTADTGASSFCLCDGGRPWTIRFSAHRVRGFVLIISGQQLAGFLPDWRKMAVRNICCEQGLSAILFELVKSLHHHRSTIDKEAGTDIARTLLETLAAAMRRASRTHQAMPSQLETYHKERIRGYVRSQLRDPALNVESVALKVGLSTRYIHRLFSTEAVPLMKWVWMERLENCYRDLSLGSLRNRSISEIAYHWGFNNPAHFSRAFRNRFGISPKNHRQRALRTPPASATSAAILALPAPARLKKGSLR